MLEGHQILKLLVFIDASCLYAGGLNSYNYWLRNALHT